MSDSVTLWTIAHQAPLATGLPMQEYWSGLPFLSPGDLPGPGIEPGSPALQVDSLPTEPSTSSYLIHKTTLEFCGLLVPFYT